MDKMASLLGYRLLSSPTKKLKLKNNHSQLKEKMPATKCYVDAHANNPGLFMTMLCPRLCVRLYCTPVHTDCDCTVV